MPTFAERMRELRERAGMTQAQLAEASGLSIGSIRNYEQGLREPYWQAAFKLAAAMGTDCRAFAGCVDAGATEEAPPAPSRGRKPPAPAPPPAGDLEGQAAEPQGPETKRPLAKPPRKGRGKGK